MKVVYEALLRLAWRGFLPWFQEHHIDDMPLLSNTIDAVKRLDDNITQQELEAAIQDPSCCNILELFSEYLDHLRHGSGPLAAFWVSYLDMVEILLALVRASREGNWLLHLAAVKAMLSWCFAYD